MYLCQIIRRREIKNGKGIGLTYKNVSAAIVNAQIMFVFAENSRALELTVLNCLPRAVVPLYTN